MRKKRDTNASRNRARFDGYLSREELEVRRAATDRRYERQAWRRFMDPAQQFERAVRAMAFELVGPQLERLVPAEHRQSSVGMYSPQVRLFGPGILDPEPVLRERKRTEVYDPCQDSKQTRRAAIINSGHGGRNGATKYRKHEDC